MARGEVNDIPVRSSRSTADIVRGNIFTRFNAIIGVLWVITLFVAPVQDALFGFVILANTGIGIVQELRAKKTLDSLAVIGEARPVVRRDGVAAEVATSAIVLDDLVETGPGDKIVVDGVVAEAAGLEVDESLLTGEADSVVKRPGDPVLSGSFVVAGAGAYTATRVGREAYAAQLAEEAARFTLVHSELRTGISTILKYVTWMMVPTALGLVVSQLFLEHDSVKDATARTIGGIVPMIPEGLVLLTSVAFAIGVIRLGRRQCLVQELPAIEGLARVDVVCLDKTGTLTEGGMDLAELRVLDGAGGTDGGDGSGRTEGTGRTEAAEGTGGAEAAEGAVGAAPADRIRAVLGALAAADPRPNASLRAVAESCPPVASVRCTRAVPFSSARKYSGGRIEEAGGRFGDWLLGAPDVLLAPGDPLLDEIGGLDRQGLRVLLLARAGHGLDGPDPTRDTAPAALVVLEQRLRPDAADTLRYFAEQGVAVKVISGDNAVSVGAVAAKLSLPGAEHTVDARTLPEDRDEMAEVLEKNTVFGRVSPQQKRTMVAALRSRGHTVAMTGDGVNDVLALKDADIGVAMGAGSEATRAVAQIVLLNNSFATLPSVVAEGRRVIGNITRVATLFLVKTVYSVLMALLVVCSQVEYPFLPRHLTLLATLVIGLPAFFLALAPNKERAQPGFVRRVMRYALPAGLIAGIATFTTYLLARAHYHGPGELDAETSAATTTLFLISLWVLAIVARPYTWWRILLVATMGAAFVIVLVVPWLQDFFALRLEGTVMPWTAVGIGLAAGALLEPVWVWAGRRFPA
ncbi:HAD-IC family P-type ATPase [Streptomyces sp. NA04227]|nr:HAD-IC family P-type ATPase [Streptomyces sp. NA04227]